MFVNVKKNYKLRKNRNFINLKSFKLIKKYNVCKFTTNYKFVNLKSLNL